MKWSSNSYEENLHLTAGLEVIQFAFRKLAQNPQVQEPKIVLNCTNYSVYLLANLQEKFHATHSYTATLLPRCVYSHSGTI